MLVIISDLHLTDGTSGATISAGAFEVFAERLQDLACAASYRADGSYRPIEQLDVLLLDLPPGTGDVQLTLLQRVPLAGAVIVSTPQEMALADVRRGLAMFEKTHAPILGVIENMAYFEAADGTRTHIFGEGGARRTAAQAGVPFLGEVPIDVKLREASDAGAPLVVSAPRHPVSKRFVEIAQAALANVARLKQQAPVIRFT